MSDPLRIGLVAEGITDKLVIQAAIGSLLGERRFILRLLQPEESLPLEKSCETWVLAALFPDDPVMIRNGWECHPNPESRLGTKPKAARVTKSKAGYEAVQAQISATWPRLRAELSEAGRFSNEIISAISP